MMSDDQHSQGPDFFEEVQEKVEREMFRGADAGAENPSRDQGRGPAGPLRGPEVEVEIVESEEEAGILDLEDAFLEEVDILPDLEEPPAAGVPGPPLAESPDFQEDDRFLRELIDREMVGRESAPLGEEEVAGGTVEETPPSEEELNTRTLADLYARQGHYDQAVSIYEKLLADDPGNPDLAAELQALRQRAEAGPAGREGGEGPFPQGADAVIRRLEGWLSRIRAEKERRCFRTS